MQDLISYYQNQIEAHSITLSDVRKQLAGSSTLRLAVFITTIFFAYLFFENTKLVLGIAVIGIGIFLFLVSRHTNLQYKRDKLMALKTINETEIQVCHIFVLADFGS